jgi:two-component system, NtrC family, sensor kinase
LDSLLESPAEYDVRSGTESGRTGWLSGWRLGRVSLRARITAAFTVVVIGGTVASTLIGSRIITNALLDEARTRNAHALDAARTIYTETLDTTARLVGSAAKSEALAKAAQSGSAEGMSPILRQLRNESGLDFLDFVPSSQIEQATGPCLRDASLRRMIQAARSGLGAEGTEVLERPCLLAQSAALADRADTRIVSAAQHDGRSAESTAGLALVAAAPVGGQGPSTGVVYGGMLLNRRSDLVERIKQLVYGSVSYRGRDTAVASIFFDDVRVATTATPEPGQEVGTVLPAEVPRTVLTSGQRWQGRALGGREWYVAAHEPLRNYSGQVVGAVYVGMLEAPILAIRTDVMLTFLLVCIVGLGIVFAFTYLITRRTISPLEEMVAATKRIAAGDLSVRVSASSRDEIGDLAASFNEMLASLQTVKSELEEWGRTLEERVRQRTEELVTVQSRMAQSEKLASIGRLAAGVAHSINNPLGGILSLSMLALESPDPTPPRLREDLKTIADQALRCREIVKGLLNFSRESDARPTRTDVTPVVDATLSLLQRQGVFHSIEVVRRFETGLPAVLINPGRLQEALSNLVLNAVDAMEESGALTVETTAAPETSEVLIRIQDTGRGITPDVMPFIFEPFFTTKKVGKGTGLGLAIVHGIVTGAGGRVEVATSPQGTTFTMRLPKNRGIE